MKPSETQSRQIQILRGIAIIAVVLTHALPASGSSDVFYRPFINFAVGLFLFLSGYLTPMGRFFPSDAEGAIFVPGRDDSLSWRILRFYGKRLRRVLPAYLFWSVAYTVYYGRYEDFLPRLLTGRCCGIYYYIFVYVQLVLLTPLLCGFIRICTATPVGGKNAISQQGRPFILGKSGLTAFLPILCVTPVAILAQYFLAWRHVYLIYPWNINSCLVWMLFYFLGLLLGNGVLRPSFSPKTLGIAYAVCLLAEIAEGLLWLSFGREDIASSQVKLSDMCLTTVVTLMSHRWLQREKVQVNLATKPLIILGNISFAIYLVHPMFISMVRHFR